MKVLVPDIPQETKDFYFTREPIYDHYKTVKVKDYCDCCGHYTGFHEEQRGVKLLGYNIIKKKKDTSYLINKLWMPKVVENIMEPSPMIERILKMTKKEPL